MFLKPGITNFTIQTRSSRLGTSVYHFSSSGLIMPKTSLSSAKIIILLALTSHSLSLFAESADDLKSEVVPMDDAKITKFDGSVFYSYFEGKTYGTKDTLTGVAVIEPGKEVHPPHKHAEEEFLMVIEGSGEWTLNDKTFKAKAGDILYAAPWDLHGVFNSGSTPLKFVVMKWNNKGVPVQPEPK